MFAKGLMLVVALAVPLSYGTYVPVCLQNKHILYSYCLISLTLPVDLC